MRHRDRPHIALVRWFAPQPLVLSLFGFLGLSTDHMQKQGSIGWPHAGPCALRYFGRHPDISAVRHPPFVRQHTVHVHGSVPRRPMYPITPSGPCSAPHSDACSISSYSSNFLALSSANGHILFGYIPRISNFHSLDHQPGRCLALHSQSAFASSRRALGDQFCDPLLGLVGTRALQNL